MRATVFLCTSLICGLSAVPALAHHCGGRHHADDCYYHDDYCWRGTAQPQSRSSARVAPIESQAIEGKIAELIYLPGATSDGGMVEARVVSGGRSTVVRLAPVGILKQKQLVLREGDAISMTGYMVNGMEGDLLVATKIRKGDQRIPLRDGRGRLIE